MEKFYEILKVITPFITFALGYATKSYTDRKIRRKELAEELLQLAQNWYEQVRKINEMIKFKDSNEQIERANNEYILSRQIMPRFISVIYELWNSKKATPLIEESRLFFFELTGSLLPKSKNDWKDLFQDSTIYNEKSTTSIYLPPEHVDIYTHDTDKLAILDTHLQKMARLVSQL
jgi:hypothetical protein